MTVGIPQPTFRLKGNLQDDYQSPRRRAIETKPSIAFTANSVKFGDEHMIRAKHDLLERESLANMTLIADGQGDPLPSGE